MSRFKGLMVGVIILALILGLSLTLILLITQIKYVQHVVSIRSKVNLFIELEDGGSRMFSLLKLKEGGVGYAEIMGSMKAENFKENANIMESFKKTLGALKINLEVYDETGDAVWNFGKLPEDISYAEIPLPGGKKGEVGVA